MPNAYFFFFLRALGGPILTILRNLANKGSGVAIARSMTDSPDRAVRSAQWPSRTDGSLPLIKNVKAECGCRRAWYDIVRRLLARTERRHDEALRRLSHEQAA